jgi:chromosome segregation ATPase
VREEFKLAQMQLAKVHDETSIVAKERDVLTESTATIERRLRILVQDATKGFVNARDLQVLAERLATAQRERNELRSTLVEVYGSTPRWVQPLEQVERLRGELTELRMERDRLRAEIAGGAMFNAQAAAEGTPRVDDLMRKLAATERELAEAKNNAGAGTAFPQALARLQERINNLVAEKLSMEKALEATENAVTNADTRAEDSERRLSSVEAELAQERAAKTKIEGECEKLASQLREREAEIEKLKEGTRDLSKTEMAPVSDNELADLRGQYLDLQERLRLVDGERERMADQMAALSTELPAGLEAMKQSRVELEQLHGRLLMVEGSVERYLEQTRTIETERNQQRTEIDSLKTALDRSKQHIQVSQARRDAMKDEIARLKAQLGLPVDNV